MFTDKDLQQFDEKGITVRKVEQQIAKFKSGFQFSQLEGAAKIPSGIKRFEEEETEELVTYYDEQSTVFSVVKFVPASGAASRMFKGLYTFKEIIEKNPSQIDRLLEDQRFNSPAYFFQHLKNFAFYQDLQKLAENKGASLEERLENKDYSSILHLLLDEEGLNYGKLPKALLKFHAYEDGSRYAIEEHLVEGVHYACDENNTVSLHFTVSEDHLTLVKDLLADILPVYEAKYGVRYHIEYSIQKPETDTIAVDMQNQPFRKEDGSILFRPGGHGALIKNLDELEYDIAFIKNIDNIVPDGLREETYTYKKVLGALLIQAMHRVKEILQVLEENEPNEKWLDEKVFPYMKEELMIRVPDEYTIWNAEQKAEYIVNKLNRPIRICGMVRNEGEPGGGPYWVNANGEVSLQIVEMSQIDTDDPRQYEILNNATHFNPVDLVCSLKDYKGEPFDLLNFVDEDTSFISEKSLNGKQLKALELPGLWNGAMADWITVFVEVPIVTFNPVKVVNDLLREQHQ